jgi:DMSO/TMAO reductase YedYZ molybdopterin-dependent catalytic subunit
MLALSDGREQTLTIDSLQSLPQTTISDCYIISTGHGTSGPFTFSGVTLLALVQAHVVTPFSSVEVLSADGFGTRVTAAELLRPNLTRPILLAHMLDGRPMSRAQGLVRLIVPDEDDDALRQVKWIGRITVR